MNIWRKHTSNVVMHQTAHTASGDDTGEDQPYFTVLVQDCSNSSANTLGLLQSCTKPSI